MDAVAPNHARHPTVVGGQPSAVRRSVPGYEYDREETEEAISSVMFWVAAL